MGYFCPKINSSRKYIPSENTLYTEGLSFNYLCEGSPNYLCHYIIFHDTTPLYFFSSNTKYFLQKQPISRLSAAPVKVHQILHIIFQTKSQFFFNVWISFSVMGDHSSILSLAETLYAIDKSSPLKCKFSDLLLLTLKFIKFLMSFLEPRVSFSSNFASLFSVMRHNSSVLFHPNLYMLWSKEAHKRGNFQTFDCSHEN